MAGSAARLTRALASALDVREGEGRVTALLFCHMLLASAIFTLGRTVRDTLFLSRYPLTALPWMFVLYGGVSSLTVLGYAQIADKLPRQRTIVISLVIGAVTYMATWGLVRAEQSWTYPVFYVWSEVAANLFIVQFWTFANDMCSPRAARRLFPTIGSARVLGVVVIGLVTSAIVRLIGTNQLFFVLVGLMAGIAVVAVVAARGGPLPGATSGMDQGTTRSRSRKKPRIAGDPYVRALAVFILVTFACLTVGDYQFKAIARATYREDELARFFSLFYAGTGVLSFVMQLGVTSWLLRRLGVAWGMAVMPTVFGGSSGLLLATPHLAVATAMKFADNGFQYTIHDTTLQALYAPFLPEIKARTRAVLDAMVKPLSYGAGGVVLVLLAQRMPVHQLSFVTVGLVVVWLGVIPLVKRRYVRALESTLRTRGSLALARGARVDIAGYRALFAVVQGDNARLAVFALGQLVELAESAPRLARLLTDALPRIAAEHEKSRVRAAAIKHLVTLDGSGPAKDVVIAALDDKRARVRATAASACAELLGDEAIDPVAPLLEDPKTKVRVRATAGLLQHGGVEGAIVAGARLSWLLTADADARREGARILKLLGTAAYQPLRRLLDDEDAGVKRAALSAAKSVADPRLLPLLIDALKVHETRRRAMGGLVAIGEPAVAPLLEVLVAPQTLRGVRLIVPRVLQQIPTESCFEGLRGFIATDDEHLRLNVLSAMERVRERAELPALPAVTVDTYARTELREGYRELSVRRALVEQGYDTPLLAERSERLQRWTHDRLIRVLGLRYAPRRTRLIRHCLKDPSRRATAIEMLDTLLEPDMRALVLPFFDDVALELKLERAREIIGDVPEPVDFLAEQAGHASRYLSSIALDALGRRCEPRALDVAREAAGRTSPMVRETAAWALRSCLHSEAIDDEVREVARGALQALSADVDPGVARQVRLALDPPDEEVTVYTTLDKITLLKGASLFSNIAAEDLVPLAQAAEVERVPAGEALFSAGEPPSAVYFVVSGTISVSYDDRVVARVGAGEVVGETSALTGTMHGATAEVVDGEAELLVIAADEFSDAFSEQVDLAEGLIRELARRLRSANRELARMAPSAAPADARDDEDDDEDDEDDLGNDVHG